MQAIEQQSRRKGLCIEVAPRIRIIKEHIAWSYANLARAHAAVSDGSPVYRRPHHIIRQRLYAGLVSGKMSFRSLIDDERLKMVLPQACSYCGDLQQLCVDHLIPRVKGGGDEAANVIWACRSCNCSKGGKDLLEWMLRIERFPPLYLLRRYLKIIASYCDHNRLMDVPIGEVQELLTPFDLTLLPYRFPEPQSLVLWVQPREPGHLS
jgi:hypothetical protein